MSEVKICPTCGSEYPMSERFCPRDGSALKSQNAGSDLVGTMIAQSYHIIKKLGEGGMGAVYLAEHVKMGRKSAIKVMNPGMNQDPDAVARFHREASNASKMNHPNICAIYDFGETTDGVIYLAMEFIEGQSLTSLIEKTGSLPPARAASILDQTASGLQVAHDYGIVHRDLKPDNIMIARGRDNSDLVKVVDFGIAKSHKAESQKVTKTGLVVGTPEYMSPEQLAGDKLDGRSDIYSLALVGFNMLTGTLPFPSETAQEAMIMRLTDQPKTLAEMKPNVAWPAELQRVMDKALARNVDERYQKASDFGREFAMAVDAMPASAASAAADGATMVIGAAASAKTAPVAAVPKTRVATPGEAERAVPAHTPTKSGRGMLIGIGSGVVIAAVAVVLVLKMNGSSANKPSGSAPPDTSAKPAADASAGVVGKKDLVDPTGGRSTPPNDGKTGGGKPGGASNPVGGSAPPNGGGSTPPNASATFERDLKELEILADGDQANGEDPDKAIEIANRIISLATGDNRARVLLFRGFSKLALDPKNPGGCTDLKTAKSTAGDSGLIGRIDFVLKNTDCQ